ncbi:MAG TPA: DUF2191 domain-containing protein [Aldersonia sp.]
MTKRLIDIDDELLDLARTELKTEGVSDTVRAALRQAAAAGPRRREAIRMIEGDYDDLADKAAREDAWR